MDQLTCAAGSSLPAVVWDTAHGRSLQAIVLRRRRKALLYTREQGFTDRNIVARPGIDGCRLRAGLTQFVDPVLHPSGPFILEILPSGNLVSGQNARDILLLFNAQSQKVRLGCGQSSGGGLG